MLQHPDDIDYIRCLFLSSNLEDSLRIIEPILLMSLESNSFNELYYQVKNNFKNYKIFKIFF